MYVCMYKETRDFLQPKQSRVGHTKKMCVVSLLQNDISVSVGSRSDNSKEFHSLGAHAAKLRGPIAEVRQASTCKLLRAAERKWRRLVLAATGTHSSWR